MTEPILDSASLDALARAVQHASEPVSLGLHLHGDGGEFQDRLLEVAHQVRATADGAIGVEERSATGSTDGGAETSSSGSIQPPALPALTLRVGDRDAIHYLALPEGPEEAPFLEALTALSGSADLGELPDQLAPLEESVEILVFVASGCPNCPHGVRATNALAAASPNITVSVVDGFLFGELASRYQVTSVPTTVVNRGLTLIGVKTREELAQHILSLQGPEADKAVFTSLVESGRFPDASGYLLDGRGIETFAELWSRSALESRISLTLIAEEALEEDPAALNDLVPLLLPSLEVEDPSRQGDTADLLATIGHPAAREALEALLDNPNPDVAEAAADALEEIE
jgi:hypothetical protein